LKMTLFYELLVWPREINPPQRTMFKETHA
jgi:hypothetical protein